jgi:MoxR-like ATPase
MKNKSSLNLVTVDATQVKSFIKDCDKLKPSSLVMDSIKWKYLVRSVMRGKNILIVGPTGCGKTLAAQTVAKALERPYFYFNLGATQDARSALIGNTHYDKNTGTYFNESAFVKAIKTPNAVILMDEVSRAHYDAWNVLMTVLDDLQRYLRLDEKKDSEVVQVAEGVCLIGTANIGNEYTSTRVMDRALMSRFPVKLEMSPLSKEVEFNYLKDRFNISETEHLYILNSIVEIAVHTRDQIKSEDSKLSNFIPTRSTVEISELILDGFNLLEIAETAIYPNFTVEGGMDSERTYVKQLVQKYIKVESKRNLFSDPLTKSEQPPF